MPVGRASVAAAARSRRPRTRAAPAARDTRRASGNTTDAQRHRRRHGGPARRSKCHDDRGDIAVAAHLADEPAAGPQRPRHAGDHGVGIGLHPVQRRVGEHGVELVLEVQAVAVHRRRASTPARAGRCAPCRARHRRPTTAQPSSASRAVSTPSPQPRSRMRSPGCGASSSTTGRPELGHEAAHGRRSVGRSHSWPAEQADCDCKDLTPML